MLLTAEQIRTKVEALGVNRWFAHLNGAVFATVSREWVAETWRAALTELRANAPELVEVRQLGAGRSQIVPRYVLNGFNCRGQHLKVYAHGLTGFALHGAKAALAGTPLDHDALAWGILEYTAEPRADNLGRAGRHEQIWFIDHAGEFQTFEAGDGEENELTASEIGSITWLYAQ